MGGAFAERRGVEPWWLSLRRSPGRTPHRMLWLAAKLPRRTLSQQSLMERKRYFDTNGRLLHRPLTEHGRSPRLPEIPKCIAAQMQAEMPEVPFSRAPMAPVANWLHVAGFVQGAGINRTVRLACTTITAICAGRTVWIGHCRHGSASCGCADTLHCTSLHGVRIVAAQVWGGSCAGQRVSRLLGQWRPGRRWINGSLGRSRREVRFAARYWLTRRGGNVPPWQSWSW